MLDYGFFYDVAEYGNKNWKGNFSPKEVAQFAHDYFTEFENSKATSKVSSDIQSLLECLNEDGSEECKSWASKIRKELNINGK